MVYDSGVRFRFVSAAVAAKAGDAAAAARAAGEVATHPGMIKFMISKSYRAHSLKVVDK